MSKSVLRLAFPALILVSGNASALVAPPPSAFSVPTLDSWGLLGLTLVAGLAGIVAIRRNRK